MAAAGTPTTHMPTIKPCLSSPRKVVMSSMVSFSSESTDVSYARLKNSSCISSMRPLFQSLTSVPVKYKRVVPRAVSAATENNPLPGLPVDLRGKRAFIAGVADDNGYGWAIAAAGAEIIVGTWVPSMKEGAANMAASAKAGMDKTKATVQEKVDKMSAHDPLQKQMATERKEERLAEAEWNKQEAREQNAASRQAAKAGGHPQYTTTGGVTGTGTGTGTGPGFGTHTHSATGATGYPTGTHQMSAVPGHGTGQPHGGHVDSSGIARTDPTRLPGDTAGTGYNPRV